MASRGESADVSSVLRSIEERLRRLEAGTGNKGTVSFGATRLGDLKLEETVVDGRAVLRVTRLSDGTSCTIDPGNCVTQVTSSAGGSSAPEVLWSVNGTLGTGQSNNYDVPAAYTLSEFLVELGTTGTSDTTVVVRKNGVAVATYVIAAAATSGGGTLNVPYADGDKYSVAITVSGTGAKDLQTQGRFG